MVLGLGIRLITYSKNIISINTKYNNVKGVNI